MIRLENVTKKYNDFIAVNNISFDIKEGEIVGFLGKNGAGKTTTMNMITGYIEPTEGKIEINGYDINKNPKKAKNEIGYMPEGVPIYNDLTVKEFVNYMADLKGVKRENKKANVQKVIEETGLSEVQNKLNRHLSRGYKQRVSMAGALVGNPKVLILDEPTVGLDPQQVKQIRDLIKSLRKDHTVLISSHILSEVSQICEKVIIIDKGNILAVDTPENLESKVSSQNILTVTVEDTDNKIDDIINKIDNIKKIELISENSDGTKQYTIFAKKDKDIRKEISEKFAKSGITILELKKTEATLEEAFLQLINNYSNNKENKEDKKDEDNNEKRGGKE
ncbi:MAG: ABC transporter ATP-binding protein [Clostridia bacterium]|nr:ABC transporter ATP-binding protein [Clostridia bacterium]